MTRRCTNRTGFTLLEVLLVIVVVAVVLLLMVGLVTTAQRSVRDGDVLVRNARAARAALDRIAADLRSCIYYGPTARYAFGLDGVAGRPADLPDPTASGDRLTLITAGPPRIRGEPDTSDDQVQRGRADLSLVIYEVQWDEPKSSGRLVRIEQSVLDAVEIGEVTVEVLCEGVERFHLQYFGQVPSGGDPLQGNLTDNLGEYRWLRDWRSGLHGVEAAQDAVADGAAGGSTPAITLDYPLPTAVQMVLLLKPAEGIDPAVESERHLSDRWFETAVYLPTSAELVRPATTQVRGLR